MSMWSNYLHFSKSISTHNQLYSFTSNFVILFHLLPFIFVHSVFLVKKDLVIKNECGGQQLVQKKKFSHKSSFVRQTHAQTHICLGYPGNHNGNLCPAEPFSHPNSTYGGSSHIKLQHCLSNIKLFL